MLGLQNLDWSTLVHLAAVSNRHSQALNVACCQQIRDYEVILKYGLAVLLLFQ